MTFAPGTRIGAYEITSPLGSGGMGEVYRARDLTLDRDVAIKVLPASFAGDAERLMRFEREAKTLASLNHPHIAQVYGLERSDDTSALVMELVEGEDLAARIARSPVPPDDALAIARQIARKPWKPRTRPESSIAISNLPTSEIITPFVSPDGAWLAFNDFFAGTIEKVPMEGGPALAIFRHGTALRGASWADDGFDRVRRLGAQSEWAVSRPGRRVASPCSRGCAHSSLRAA